MLLNQHTFAILAYKESSYLQECIDSLKKQEIASEIIICTSTPSIFLEAIAKKNYLPLFVNPEKNGIAADWNFALQKATTPYVTLTHQDDIYLPAYSQQILQAARARKDALIIFSDYEEIITANGQTTIRKNSLNFFVKRFLAGIFFRNKNYITRSKERLLSFGNPISCPTVTFHKDRLGDFQFDANFGINLDWKAWYDLAQKDGSFVWVKNILLSHRIYADSETSLGLVDNRRQKEDFLMFCKFWPPAIASLINKIYSLSYKNNQN
jgi:glycosyltransferase involved in cell wall biosynthesis